MTLHLIKLICLTLAFTQPIIAGRKPKPFNKFSETLTPEANRAYHYIINKFNQHHYFKTIGEQASEGDVFIAHQSLANAQIKEYIKSYTPDGFQLNQSNGRYYLQYKDTIATLFKLSLRRKTSEQAQTYSYKIWVLNNQNTTYYYFEKITKNGNASCISPPVQSAGIDSCNEDWKELLEEPIEWLLL